MLKITKEQIPEYVEEAKKLKTVRTFFNQLKYNVDALKQFGFELKIYKDGKELTD